jgi:hypothetical protein
MNKKLVIRFAALLALAAGWFAVPAAHAQEPTANALAFAQELIITKGANALFDPVIPGVIETAKNSFIPTNPSLGRELNEVAAVLHKEYEPAKRTDLLKEVARVYAQRFTEQELRDMVVFYKSPLGQKMIKQEPVALEQSFKQAQTWADGFSEVVLGRFRAEMQKKGHPL